MKRKIYAASHFNDQFEIYDIRPGYPQELYEAIGKYKTLDSHSTILEIGAGNGIASQEIYNMWGSKLTLLEPGRNFYEALTRIFTANKNIDIENTTFENFQTPLFYDVIFSATAFHWLDLSIKYRKSFELLKDDGLLILYWNNYLIENISIYSDIQAIYFKYGMGLNKGKNPQQIQLEKIESRKSEINDSGYFKVIDHSIFKNSLDYSPEAYIKLLQTFPDHAKLPESFFEEITQAISLKGNKIQIGVVTNLEIAEKCRWE